MHAYQQMRGNRLIAPIPSEVVKECQTCWRIVESISGNDLDIALIGCITVVICVGEDSVDHWLRYRGLRETNALQKYREGIGHLTGLLFHPIKIRGAVAPRDGIGVLSPVRVVGSGFEKIDDGELHVHRGTDFRQVDLNR